MTKYTPGPWFRSISDDMREHGYIRQSTAVDGRYPAVAKAMIHGKRRNETLANMALIAAAPELLAALSAIVSSWEKGGVYAHEIDNARDAIAKATQSTE